MHSEKLYQEFLNVAEKLNIKLGVIPILYGSLGLERITNINFNPQDIDILVPQNFIESEWNLLKEALEEMQYSLVDLHEHKFLKSKFEIGFAFEEDLMPFAGINYNSLRVIEVAGVKYRLLKAEDYLKVYKKSLTDGYRRSKNNNKDKEKIKVLESIAIQ